MLRLRFSVAALFAAGVACAPPAQAASAYPQRPVRVIVPFPPGGGNDILARAVGQKLSEVMGQQVVVDNRGGAGGLVGATLAATAAPDGYTLFLGSLGNLAHNPALQSRPPYDPVRDFAPVMLLATSSFILVVNPSLPAKSVADLIALARAKPRTLNYASAGQGSSLHMTAELFKHATGADIVHVAYKGTAPATVELIAGATQLMFSTMPPALPHVASGKLRALATTAAKRSPAAPDVPTVIEGGVAGFEVLNWQGLVAPARTPPSITEKLHRDLATAMEQRSLVDTLSSQGLEAARSTPGEFGRLIRSELERYRKLVVAARIAAE